LDIDSYAEESISAIESYVKSGGALVIFPGTSDLSNFESLSGSTVGGWEQLDRNASRARCYLCGSGRKKPVPFVFGAGAPALFTAIFVLLFRNVSPRRRLGRYPPEKAMFVVAPDAVLFFFALCPPCAP
jgi:hypothetical protein